MFTYKKIEGENDYEAHLDVEKYTHNTKKQILTSLKIIAKEKNYPNVWTYLPKHKQRIAEHFGFRLIRNKLVKDGLYAVMLMETKDVINKYK